MFTNGKHTRSLNNACIREFSSLDTEIESGTVYPYNLLGDDIKYVMQEIRDVIKRGTNQPELQTMAEYYFDGQGKALRPMIVLMMAKAINCHIQNENSESMESQRQLAVISEMFHSASLVHNDVIDQSTFRKGKLNVMWNQGKVVMTGDYILSLATILLSRLKNNDVTANFSQIISDLVQGEIMQLGATEIDNEKSTHYLTKTFNKTPSLLANSLKSVAVLAGADEPVSNLAFQYGRNVGLALQLVDDLLDFVSSAKAMGKPAGADLKLGLTTAPVLLACKTFPELNPMIMRRFGEPGDVERAFELVHKSEGLEESRFLSRKHCIEAKRLAQQLPKSPYTEGLIILNEFVLNRIK